MLPPECIDGRLLRGHEHVAYAPGELLESGETAPGPPLVLPHTLEAFYRIAVVAGSCWQALQPKARLPMGQRRCERGRPVQAAALDDHHDLLPRGAKRRHHLVDRVPNPLGIKLEDDFIEDFGCTL